MTRCRRNEKMIQSTTELNVKLKMLMKTAFIGDVQGVPDFHDIVEFAKTLNVQKDKVFAILWLRQRRVTLPCHFLK